VSPDRLADGAPADDPPAAGAAEYPIDGVLDLHQFRPADARDVVGDYLDACREKGVVDVRIIHGKGKGVLRRIVHSVLNAREDVETFRLATDTGSWGATILRLKPISGRGESTKVAGIGTGGGTSLVVAVLCASLMIAAAGCAGRGDESAGNATEEQSGTTAPGAVGATSEERGEPEATSLMGTPLYRPELSPERRAALEENLAAALADYEADPNDEGAIIWYGRRLAYLSRYRDAIDVYGDGIANLPDSFKLLRHRGHRYISTRQFDLAVADLERAAELAEGHPVEIEPDGAPNALNIPLSNGHFNIWYHLGLAYYLNGNYEAARDAYLRCMEFSDNTDLLVATSDWLYMTYRRLGLEEEATALLEAITSDMEIVENDAYHRRLLMYKGEVAPDELLDLRAEADPDVALNIATQGYGVGNWYYVNGDVGQAAEILRRILEGTSWAAFGYIAAEADVHRFVQQQ